MSKPVCIMLVAAEASGDALGAQLAQALRRKLGEGNVRFVGVGGARLAEEGVKSPFDIGDLSILGLVDGLLAYPRVVAKVKEAAALAANEQPDIAVLIDSWGFTLRVAQALRRERPGLPIVKYVGPQIFASRPGRAKTLAATVDHLLSINVLDAPYYEAVGLPSTFVGNPALSRDMSDADPTLVREEIGAEPDDQILVVMPGSRPSEIKRMTPAFEGAVSRLKATRPHLHVVVPAAATVVDRVKAWVAGWPFRGHVVEGEALKYSAMKAATVALACSGTVSTELALAGCPMVIAYRIDPISYPILMRLMRVRYLTLFNLAADAAVAPEFWQDAASGEALAAAVAERLDNAAVREKQIAAQFAALEVMGRGVADPSERAADVVLDLLGKSGHRFP